MTQIKPLKYWVPAAVLWVLFGWWVQPGFAGIYKYTDDQGKVHFTDDKSKIPAKYLKKEKVQTIKGLNKGALSLYGKGEASAKGEGEGAPGDAEGEGEKLMSDEAKADIAAAISYLKSDATRNESLTGKPPSRMNGRKVTEKIRQSLAGKKQMAEKLAKHDIPALKSTHAFLKSSIAQDELVKNSSPASRIGVRAMQSRLGGEVKTAQGLIKDLEQALEEAKKKEVEALEAEAEGEGEDEGKEKRKPPPPPLKKN